MSNTARIPFGANRDDINRRVVHGEKMARKAARRDALFVEMNKDDRLQVVRQTNTAVSANVGIGKRRRASHPQYGSIAAFNRWGKAHQHKREIARNASR